MENTTKRATNKDVAKLAGVSVATVSYVINGRSDMRIPEETKKKVIQAMNFLNYSPNPFAASLKSKQPRSVVVRTSKNSGFLQDIETMIFLRSLNPAMRENKYSLSYAPDKMPEKLSAEACVCFDMTREEFHALGNENFIPLIAVDCVIADPIFYQVIPDYQKIKSAAEAHFGSSYEFVAILPSNTELRESILELFPDAIFVSNLDDVRALRLNKNNLLLTNPSLFSSFQNAGLNIFKYDTHLALRPGIIANCIKNAVNRINVEDPEHFIKV